MATVVSLALVKEHLRVLHDNEDALITEYIGAAVAVCEDYCDASFSVKSVSDVINAGTYTEYTLKSSPLIAITDAGPFADNYVVRDEDGIITLDLIAPVNLIEPSVVTYTVGLEELPPAVRQAILLLTGHFYQNRESVVSGASVVELPQGVQFLLSTYREYN